MKQVRRLFSRSLNKSERRRHRILGRSERPSLELLEVRCLLSGQPLATPPASALASYAAQYEQLPLSFVPNAGQLAAPVQFSASGSGYSLFLMPTGAAFSLRTGGASNDSVAGGVQMQLEGANPGAQGTGADPDGSVSNYFVGQDPSQWHSQIADFARVQFAQVYPGVNLTYYGNQSQLEYDFDVAAGANPNVILLSFAGAQNLSLDAAGNLEVQIAGGDLIEHAPILYQMNGAQREAVAGSYVIGSDNTVHFQVGPYDHSLPLVIDPVLSYATYLGGSAAENGQAVAVDSTGNVYITGFTGSTNFPTQTPFQGQLAGQGNVFVSKLNPAGTGLVYSTYVGGGGLDLGLALRVDSAGDAYVAGTTSSSNFPMKNAIQGTYGGGGSDAFVFKLNPAGTQLVFSTFLGGADVDYAQGLALDSSNNIYVVGFTDSANFPRLNGLQSTSGGGQDAWVAKIASSGTTLVYSTFLGGARMIASVRGYRFLGRRLCRRRYLLGKLSGQEFLTTLWRRGRRLCQ